jgi:hypothetical protein
MQTLPTSETYAICAVKLRMLTGIQKSTPIAQLESADELITPDFERTTAAFACPASPHIERQRPQDHELRTKGKGYNRAKTARKAISRLTAGSCDRKPRE